jgi:phospholipase/carboxylesterase
MLKFLNRKNKLKFPYFFKSEILPVTNISLTKNYLSYPIFCSKISQNEIYTQNKKYKTFKKMESYFKTEKSGDDIFLTPIEGYEAVLIFMHGLGDSAYGYQDFFDSITKPIPDRIKVVLLTAPRGAVTINGGIVMNSWYDIKSFSRSEDSIEQSDVEKNGQRILKCIDQEAKALGGDYSKIFLGGFSQGACMTLHVGLTAENKIGGLIVLSGLLFPFTAKEIISKEKNKDINVFISHGTYDDVIPEPLSKTSYKPLYDLKYSNLTYKSYDMPHTISFEQFNDVKNFITKLL